MGLVVRWFGAWSVMLLAACAAPAPEPPRVASYAPDPAPESLLGQGLGPWLQGPPERAGVRLLARGEEAFALRAASAELAQHTLDLQYYIVADDATATLLLARALRAADRGVRVRLLVDDHGTVDAQGLIATLDLHPNVHVRLYNPYSARQWGWLGRALELLGDTERLGRRMHNKAWIADNTLAIVGGRNLGNAYFGFERGSDFADLDALLVGPLVRQVSRSFDDFWNSASARPLAVEGVDPDRAARLARLREDLQQREQGFRDTAYAVALRSSEVGPALRDGRIGLVAATGEVVTDRPEKSATADPASPMVALLRAAGAQAQRELLLVSPYFVPSERGVEALCALVRRGLRVGVLTNSLASTDVPVVHAGYARKRPALLACGVDLHELKAGPKAAGRALSSGASLHAKAVLVDRRLLIVGSMNLDPRSRHLNTELALRLTSPELGAHLGALFDEAVAPGQAWRLALATGDGEPGSVRWLAEEDGQPVARDDEPDASLWRHLSSQLLGALAPEELL